MTIFPKDDIDKELEYYMTKMDTVRVLILVASPPGPPSFSILHAEIIERGNPGLWVQHELDNLNFEGFKL